MEHDFLCKLHCNINRLITVISLLTTNTVGADSKVSITRTGQPEQLCHKENSTFIQH